MTRGSRCDAFAARIVDPHRIASCHEWQDRAMTTPTPALAAGTIRLGDLTVPRMGFGAMRLPGPGVWGPPADRAEAVAVVRRAVELGVRAIDSAWYYGLDVANEVIAEAIRPYPEDLVLITKLGGARTDDGRWFPALRPDQLRAGNERDLRVLGVDAVPVTHLRWIDQPDTTFAEALDAMIALQTEGRIRHIGLSNVTESQFEHALSKTPIVSVSNQYGPTQQEDSLMVDLCAARGVAYLPFFPLAAGRVGTEESALDAVAVKHGVTPAQMALAWLLHRSPAILTIPGTSRVAHLDENVAAAAIPLDADDIASLVA
jgi:pyridoxine 4-dehydrogenase